MSKPSNSVANWLFTGAIMVAIIVILGGITRLTNSGLSMVRWEPISGILPPIGEAGWQAEFEHYKSFPEYQQKNLHFTLADFKQIYFWEYLHRLFARAIGLVFIIPFFFFLFTKKLKHPKLRLHLLIIFFLGAFQGFLGWFMVKSGLIDQPRVSHYRLASHLLSALFLFGYIFWIGLQIKYQQTALSLGKSKIRTPLLIFLLILILQITYGAFMAGLDAGFFYPTFPMMGNSWGPENVSMIFAEEGMLSIMQNPFLVQFIHRWIPILLLGIIIWLFINARKDQTITSAQSLIIQLLASMFVLQFILGVLTIIYGVPVSLGVIHQFGALILLSLNIVSLFLFRRRNAFN